MFDKLGVIIIIEVVMEKVVEKLDNINQTLEKMLGVMQKPENKFIRALKIVGLSAGALAIFNIVENIIKWVIGG